MISKTALVLALVLSSHVLHAADAPDCNLQELAESKTIKDTGLKTGKAQFFVEETGELKGFQLMRGEKELAWTNQIHVVVDRLFFRKCASTGEKPDWFKGEGVYGDCPHKWFYVLHKHAEFKPRDVALPGYDFISNGTFCGSKLAYYAAEKGKRCKGDMHAIDGVIFDLKTIKVTKRANLACMELATDNEGHFPAPEWKKGAVVFEAEPDKKTTVSIK